MDITTKEMQPSAEKMEEYMAQWMMWLNAISAKGQLAKGGNHFSPDGYVLRSGNIRETGPYTVNNESVAGYIIVLAKDINDAVSLAESCPILNGQNTSVEVRETAMPGESEGVESR